MIGDMYGDFSRLTFAPEKHFSSVLIQQGRVMLDADANEHSAIVLHRLRRLAHDLIGPYAGPAGADANFQIGLDEPSPGEPTLTIANGRYYVRGLLCEADADATFYGQPDAFFDPELSDHRLPDPPYLVYLRVWERHITAVQDPSIRERALGDNGPDTAARSKVVWQVLATADFPPGADDSIGDWPALDAQTARDKWQEWEDALAAAEPPRLRARARQAGPDELDPCNVSPEARYYGLENQLYRVEIHTAGAAAPAGSATFKWSRDNGAAVFPIERLSGSEATVLSLGRDPGLGLMVNDWVELLDDRSVLRGEHYPLLRVLEIEPLDRRVVLEGDPPAGVGQNPEHHPFLRRWDHQAGPAARGFPALDPDEGVLELTETVDGEDGWLPLENGIQIQFQQGGEYTAGDYWLIAARTALEDVEWPQDAAGPTVLPPIGIDYAYAPLALVDGANVHDLRSLFAPLAQPAP
jgi:Family of unknown function (DUF6519)